MVTLLAALLTGLAAAGAVALATGRLPPRLSVRRPRSEVSEARLWLVQAGVDLTAVQFWGASAVLGVAAGVLVTLVTRAPAVAIVPAVAVAVLPRAYFARVRARRLRRLQEAWPDGLRDLLAHIAAGLTLHHALVRLAADGPPPLRDALRRYPGLARMIGVTAALEVVKEELADPTSDRVLEVLILAHEKGGHILADVLRDLAEATTRDVRTLDELATDSLEQKINARAVFLLPWFVLLLLTSRDGFFRDFYRSPAGVAVVVVGALLSVTGMAIVARLGREPVEQRVLGSAAAPPEAGGGR